MSSREPLVCTYLGIQHRHCHFCQPTTLSTSGPVPSWWWSIQSPYWQHSCCSWVPRIQTPACHCWAWQKAVVGWLRWWIRRGIIYNAGEQFYTYRIDSYEPFNVRAPRPVPYAYRDKLWEKLDQMVRDNVIAPVTTPTEWCVPVVVTPEKDSDDIRLCVDLSSLNKYIKRERYLSPSPHEAVADITSSDATYFTTIDALSRYWQVPLALNAKN